MKHTSFAWIALFGFTANATTTAALHCDIKRVTDSRDLVSKVVLLPDAEKEACVHSAAVNIEICYQDHLGNFAISAYDRDNKVVDYVVLKYGSAATTPKTFELNSEIEPGENGREMIIATCSKH